MRRLNKFFPYQKPSKNRSSKDLNLIIDFENPVRCCSLDQLKEYANREVHGADEELRRRLARIERRKANKGV